MDEVLRNVAADNSAIVNSARAARSTAAHRANRRRLFGRRRAGDCGRQLLASARRIADCWRLLLIAAVILLAPYCRPQIVWTAATQETSASCIATNSSNQSMKPTAHYDITAVCLP